MKNYPQYVKVTHNVNGVIINEWAVRLYAKQIDKDGKKLPTPSDLLNRYYRTSNFVKSPISMFSNKKIYLTIEDIHNEQNVALEIFD